MKSTINSIILPCLLYTANALRVVAETERKPAKKRQKLIRQKKDILINQGIKRRIRVGRDFEWCW